MGNLSLKSKHRLMCGDSTNPDDVAVLMDGETPNLMVTYPPYGVEYDAAWRNGALSGESVRGAMRKRGEGPVGAGV